MNTILIVDDSPISVKLLHSMLIKPGYKIREATCGSMALSSALKNPPDMILLDIMMPDMDGYEVCEKIKAHQSMAGIPIIFITAAKEPLDKVRAFSIGAVDYITKPYELEEVLLRVRTHFALRNLQKQLEQNLIISKAAVKNIQEYAKLLEELIIDPKQQTYLQGIDDNIKKLLLTSVC